MKEKGKEADKGEADKGEEEGGRRRGRRDEKNTEMSWKNKRQKR